MRQIKFKIRKTEDVATSEVYFVCFMHVVENKKNQATKLLGFYDTYSEARAHVNTAYLAVSPFVKEEAITLQESTHVLNADGTLAMFDLISDCE